MMITIFIFLLLLGILGMVVEYTKCARKPNYSAAEESDDHLINHLYLQTEGMGREEDGHEPEQQAYLLADKQLVKSKTLWGILALSFSFSRNFKKLFQMSFVQPKNEFLRVVDGIRVILLGWVITGTTFMFSFYALPSNFTQSTLYFQDTFFNIVANNMLAFDGLFFISGFIVVYELLRRH